MSSRKEPVFKGKRFLLFIYGFGFGGAERQLCLLARFLKDSGADVRILVLKEYANPYQDVLGEGIDIVSAGYQSLGAGVLSRLRAYFGAGLWLRSQVKRFSPDTAVSYLTLMNVAMALSCIGTDCPVVVCERVFPDQDSKTFWTVISRFVYRFAAAVVVQTNRHRELLAPVFGKRVLEIPNFLVSRNGVLPEWNSREKVVVAAGRLEYQKGFDLLIEAFQKVVEKTPEWKLRIFGEGGEREELQRQIDSAHLGSSVELCGTTESLFEEFLRAQVFVLSSRYEGYPNVLTEAMEAGVAVVSTDCDAGPAEIVEHDRSALLVPSGSAVSLREALSEVLTDDRRREEFGVAALSRFEELCERKRSEELWGKLLGRLC